MKKKQLWILVILYILWIYSHSFMNGTLSSQESGYFTNILLGLFHQIHISVSFEQLHHFIRKLAHFTEYAGLGLLTFVVNRKQPLLKKTHFFVLGLIIPAIDETIQLFTPDRQGAITDVLLDYSGYLTGALVLYLIFLMTRRKINR